MTVTEILMLSQTALLALTAIIVAYYAIETRRLRAAAAAQLQAIQRKEKRDEWRDAMRDADRLLQEQLTTLITGVGGVTNLERLLVQVASEMMSAKKWHDSAFADTIFAKYTADAKVDSYRGMASLISDIWYLLDGFAKNLSEKDGALVSFYVSYFQGVTSRLHIIGAISDNYFQKTLGPIIATLMHKAAGWPVHTAAVKSVGAGD